jgi:hypothetical protein
MPTQNAEAPLLHILCPMELIGAISTTSDQLFQGSISLHVFPLPKYLYLHILILSQGIPSVRSNLANVVLLLRSLAIFACHLFFLIFTSRIQNVNNELNDRYNQLLVMISSGNNVSLLFSNYPSPIPLT